MQFLSQLYARFLIALVFFTRIPLSRISNSPMNPGNGTVMVPLVGALIGLYGGIILSFGARMYAEPWIPALLCTIALVLITGALHEDGLADFADSLGGVSEGDRVRILRDSRLGTYGVIALIAGFSLRVSAIALILSKNDVVAATGFLVATHCWSRTAALHIPGSLPCMKDSRLGILFSEIPKRELYFTGFVGAVISCVSCWVFTGFTGAFLAVVLGGMTSLILERYIRKKYKEYNGDLIGATQQLCEIFILLYLASL